jgi:hypothetical protein
MILEDKVLDVIEGKATIREEASSGAGAPSEEKAGTSEQA